VHAVAFGSPLNEWHHETMRARFASEYGLVFALVALVAVFSFATFGDQADYGPAGAAALASDLIGALPRASAIAIITRDVPQERTFAASLAEALEAGGLKVVAQVHGAPVQARQLLTKLEQAATQLDAVACTAEVAGWSVLADIARKYPALGEVRIFALPTYRWSLFLTWQNLVNIANQSSVYAILAVGMTLVIIAGGIDLSVGSLMALAAVTATLLIRDLGGAYDATPMGMTLACLAAIGVCAIVGLGTGVFVTAANMPPFIVTLAVMLIARGLAYVLAENQSIYAVPAGFTWLGRDADLAGIPNVVVLMGILYLVAHLVMVQTTLGRYIYAIGSNREAAWLSGVPVRRVLLLVYVASAALAGLGGVIQASLLRSGSPIYGQYYELYVIAAVVVGGTSLSGGEGRILGSLLGTLLIVVIQVGMNMVGIDSNWQQVVFGGVILGAVLLDQIKKPAR
jgi:ribose transport system permease protein